MIVDPKLAEFASEIQKTYIEAVNDNGSFRAASKALGLSADRVRMSMRALEEKAARLGYAPGHFSSGVAPGYLMGKVTVERKHEDGTRTWERQSPDEARQLEMMKATVLAMSAEIKPAKKTPIPALGARAALLANLYTITDYHIGMAASACDGGGADWDLQTAEDLLVSAITHLAATSPRARVGILNQLGDLLHYDGLLAVTPTSGNVVDAAARADAMVTTVIRVMRRVVAILLQHHEVLHVIIAEGNHDLYGSLWLRKMFVALFENEPRVIVNDNPTPYYAIQHGQIALFFHHGHKKNKDSLPGLFAAMYRKIWGATVKAYIQVGHMHHVDEKEFPGCKVIQHPTLAAPDSHSLRGGYMSEREMTVISYHEDFGQVARTTVTPEMLEAA